MKGVSEMDKTRNV